MGIALRVRRAALATLQVNMGDLCNQQCTHCHVNASPQGSRAISRKVCDDIIAFLGRTPLQALDITGGAPELSPHFEYLVRAGRPLVPEVIVRSNLTVLFEAGKGSLPDFFKEQKVRLICSLPCYTRENVDKQRGQGVFEKSIKALRLLNSLGFGMSGGLPLDLVYNPGGPFLPGNQRCLENDYKRVLKESYGVGFGRLLTITNVPISRFQEGLLPDNGLAEYTQVLEKNFNPATIPSLMCRTSLSVGYDGRLYDCDFNLVLGLAHRAGEGEFRTIANASARELEGREVITGAHCLACTAGEGSSCQGALAGG